MKDDLEEILVWLALIHAGERKLFQDGLDLYLRYDHRLGLDIFHWLDYIEEGRAWHNNIYAEFEDVYQRSALSPCRFIEYAHDTSEEVYERSLTSFTMLRL